MLETITKRDGRVVPFDSSKITLALEKAFTASHLVFCTEDLKQLTDKVISLLEPEKELTVEHVQDIVEKVLMKSNYEDVAKNYILYRNHRNKLRDSNTYLNKLFKELISSEAEGMDLKRENANIDGNAPMGIMLRMGSESNKEFCKKYMIDPEYVYMHDNGLIHIHKNF